MRAYRLTYLFAPVEFRRHLFPVNEGTTLKLPAGTQRLGNQVAGTRYFDLDDGFLFGFAHVDSVVDGST